MNRLYFMLEKNILNRDLYRKITLVICLLYFMPSTLSLTNLPMKIAFLWGLLIALYEFLIKKNFFNMKYKWLLIAILLSFFITIILNINHLFLPSVYNFGYLIISLVVFFPADIKQTQEQRKEEMYTFNMIFIGVVFIAAVVSLVQFLFLISYHVPTGTPGLLARQGFMEHRLFGIYTSPNVGAIFGYCSIVLSVINLLLKKSTMKMKLFFFFNFAIQLIYLILSSSRGGQVVTISFLVLSLLLYVIPKFRNTFYEVTNIRNRWMIFTILFLLLFLLFGNTPTKNMLGKIPTMFENKTEFLKEDKEVAGEEKIVIEHSDENAELSAGRFTIWQAGFKTLNQSPLFGYGETDFYGNSDGSILDKVNLSTLDKNELKRAHGNMHNGYVQVLVISGIVGFVFIYTFYAFNILSLIKRFVSTENNSPSNSDYLLLGIILVFMITIFIDEMVEVHLLFNKRDVISMIFWYYLGYLSNLYLKKGEK
ncbi:O-antigen ligase family protein [Enterococcus avium]|uniref:O-antigen ligase family protein n=2 Tax=Enterococcus avium TaxID=33945 RepID=UPI00159DFFC1|nr:O-antigen ligase family protein [Enterococcus avium]MDT2393803.1 O-antigen ligase family protein [Enterococcus avium]MDT2418189.1 O-antigen ligase family protein [Enterococcus avium]MDT2431001.1 O-antigen ligase family protein [Enterococcus avium]MDT2440267.1 O-antigen ligase family protein [Enterococcus avium]MDT2453188.1 O-antigen ligase family protein [Enterococcus avium]